jgi:hypothetical protein
MMDKLPNCVGYIDGTHVKLEEAPSDDHESYFSRKQQYSIQVQAIVDNERRIRDIYIGFPGSVHDARVFANSNISQHPGLYFGSDQWIAGDSAYPLTDYLITPFRRNTPNIREQDRLIFSKRFSKYRVIVENAFGILKEVFGSLKELRIRVNKRTGHSAACNWILACCILYNIVRPVPEDYGIELQEPEDDDYSGNNGNGVLSVNAEERRRNLFHWVLVQEA